MKEQKLALIGFMILLAISLLQCKSKPTEENELQKQLDDYFKQEVLSNSEDTECPGLSIIITEKDSIIYIGNFGLSNLENKTKITENTVFDIASTSKQFTGMAIAILEDQGKINVSYKIVKYLPDLPECMHEITIYQLVHHTSGIRDWPALFGLQGWQAEDQLSIDDIYELLKKQKSLNFNPGTGFLYSNSNYNLLIKIIEEATNIPFQVWVSENIFSPLDMNNTFYVAKDNKTNSSVACSYLHNGQNYLPFSNQLYAPGSSSLKSTTKDISKWLINFYNFNLGDKSILERTTQKGKLSNGDEINYGYGLNITKVKNMNVYAHDGAWGGYRTITAFFPEQQVGVVILSNNGTLNPQELINDIVDIIFKLEKEKETKASDTEEVEINNEFFALCAGKYEQVDDKGCYLTFFKEGNEYFVNIYDNDYKLYAKSDSVFYVKEAEAEFVFHLEDGKVNSHTLNQNGNSYLAIKELEEKNECKINFNHLTGSYYSSELDVEYEIIYEDKNLKIRTDVFPMEISLEYYKGMSFSCSTGLIQSISFIENNGIINSLSISNPRAKNILFQKIN